MKKFMLLASAMVLMFATSCLKEEATPSSTTSATYKGRYTIINEETKETVELTNVGIEVKIPTASEKFFDITFKNLSFVPGSMPEMDIIIPHIPFETTISDNENSIKYIFTAYDLIPKVGDVEYRQYQVKEIKGNIGLDVVIRFSVYNVKKDSTYTVEFTNVPSQGGGDNQGGGNQGGGNNQGGGDNQGGNNDDNKNGTTYAGKYIITNTDIDKEFEFPNVEIVVEIPSGSNSTLNATFKGLTFTPEGDMPPMDITISNIQYTTVLEGESVVGYNIEGNDIVPKVGDKEFSQYQVKKITGIIGSTVTIEFTLSQKPYKVKFTNQE